MEKKIYYEDNWLNQHLNRVGLLDKKLSLSGVMCCVCGSELTIEEDLKEGQKLVWYNPNCPNSKLVKDYFPDYVSV